MNPKEHIKHVSSRTFYGEFLRTQSISLWTLWFILSPYFILFSHLNIQNLTHRKLSMNEVVRTKGLQSRTDIII